MKLYHGSLETIEHPMILQPNRRVEKKATQGYVNIYELDETVLTKLKCLIFSEPTEDWVDFVMKNRMQLDFTHDYDIVYGPVADDSVYTQFTLYEGGIISMPTLIRELKTYKLVDQYLFHTEEALRAIRFVESKIVKS